MTRLEKKCFLGAAGFHGLLLLVFALGSAFMSPKFVDVPPVIDLLAAPTDRPGSSGGGNPNSTQPQAMPPQQAAPPAQPKPPEPAPPKPIKPPERESDPPKRAEPVRKTETRPKETVKKEPAREKGEIPIASSKKPTPKPDISTNLVVRSNQEAIRKQRELAQARADQEAARQAAERKAWQEYANQRSQIAKDVGSLVGNVGKSIGKDTVVDVGAGPGGEAFANYGGLVSGTYRRAIESQNPQNDQLVSAVIRTTVARDGTVLKAEFLQRTGSSLLDKAVDRALKSVRSVPAFPAGAKDTERTFTIELTFQPKRASA